MTQIIDSSKTTISRLFPGKRAIVATRVTGCVDAVRDGLTGTLVEPYNPEALAAGVLAYVTSPSL